jgi:hypothetical protein
MREIEKITPSRAASTKTNTSVVRLSITIPLAALDATVETGDGDPRFGYFADLVRSTGSASTFAHVAGLEASPYFSMRKMELEAAADGGDAQAARELERRKEKRRRKRRLFES